MTFFSFFSFRERRKRETGFFSFNLRPPHKGGICNQARKSLRARLSLFFFFRADVRARKRERRRKKSKTREGSSFFFLSFNSDDESSSFSPQKTNTISIEEALFCFRFPPFSHFSGFLPS